jgi:hypothetical protein
LDDVLCERHERVVGNDNCVSFEGLRLQIPSERCRCNYVKVRVTACKHIDGSLSIFYGPRRPATTPKEGR